VHASRTQATRTQHRQTAAHGHTFMGAENFLGLRFSVRCVNEMGFLTRPTTRRFRCADVAGGGVISLLTSFVGTNMILTNNTAGDVGGGIYIDEQLSSNGVLLIDASEVRAVDGAVLHSRNNAALPTHADIRHARERTHLLTNGSFAPTSLDDAPYSLMATQPRPDPRYSAPSTLLRSNWARAFTRTTRQRARDVCVRSGVT